MLTSGVSQQLAVSISCGWTTESIFTEICVISSQPTK